MSYEEWKLKAKEQEGKLAEVAAQEEARQRELHDIQGDGCMLLLYTHVVIIRHWFRAEPCMQSLQNLRFTRLESSC
jgi:hypothetical protein